ncbi:hypothetical protein E5D57_013035 [Metarhizium anisopliae]|nr:hypothetical protein E5D57_013035 [Metarhizium anisopliae]
MQQRFIRAKIEGEDKTWPVLDVAYWIGLFVIDVDTGESNRGIPAPLHEVNIFATGTDEVTLTAQLDGDDFCIPQNIQDTQLRPTSNIVTGESNAGGNAPPSRGNLPGLKASENRYAQAFIA